MSNPILRLREASEALSPTERSVAAQIISDPNLVLDNSIRSLAQKVFCSTATIVRLCNHIGYPGYRDFRQAVAYALAVRDQTKRHQQQAIERNDSLEQIIEKITYPPALRRPAASGPGHLPLRHGRILLHRQRRLPEISPGQ